MKNSLLLLFSVVILSGCSKDENPDDTNNCPEPEVGVYSGGGIPRINIALQNNFNLYGMLQVQHGPTGFNLGSGTITPMEIEGHLNVESGQYDVYVRGNCGGDAWSDWTGPKFVTVN